MACHISPIIYWKSQIIIPLWPLQTLNPTFLYTFNCKKSEPVFPRLKQMTTQELSYKKFNIFFWPSLVGMFLQENPSNLRIYLMA